MTKLELLRRTASLTQTELAKKSGVSITTISKIETAGTSVARVGTLLKLAEAIGCEVADFF